MSQTRNRPAVTLAVLASTLAFTAAPAFAGPIGSGLWFTEEVLRKHMAARTITLAVADGCAGKAAESLRARQDVSEVSAREGKLNVVFHEKVADSHHHAVRATVTEACRVA